MTAVPAPDVEPRWHRWSRVKRVYCALCRRCGHFVVAESRAAVAWSTDLHDTRCPGEPPDGA